MVLRVFVTACLLMFSSINYTAYGAKGSEGLRVEDITPEMLAQTLPPEVDENDADLLDEADQGEDVGQRNEPLHNSTSESLNNTDPLPKLSAETQNSDPTLQYVIQTLENDADRKELLTALKVLNGTNLLNPHEFVFVNMFANTKSFLKSIVLELKSFAQGLIKKDTWSFKLNTKLFKELKKNKGMRLLYILMAALIAQVCMAVLIGAAFPPFFGKLDKNASVQTVTRTLISVGVFFLTANILKTWLIINPAIQAYGEEAVITLFMLQLGLMLLRLSISTGVLPAHPEHRQPLFAFLTLCMVLIGGYMYAGHFISAASKSAIVTKPLSQLFWGVMTGIVLGAMHRYRHVIEGMLFRKIPSTENRVFLGLQQSMSGSVHYVITAAIILTYCSWFVGNLPVFNYFREQLSVTMAVLLGLSIVSYLMVLSTGYLISTPDQVTKIAGVTHRLIDMLAFVAVGYIAYRWIAPLLATQGISTENLSDKIFGIFVIIALTIIIIHMLNRLLNSSTAVMSQNKHLKTFLPIVDRLSKLVVFAVAGLLLLIEMNVNIMPIIASFSVLGLGIGLASKSIIEDFINGLFIIQENDFNIGDVVTIGSITGSIENITLRKLHIRDAQGFMNFIPFSSVGTITNRSRDFNLDKIDIPLPSAFHLKRTISILEDVGKQLLHDPELKGYVISVPKFIGVSGFQASSNPNSEVNTVMQFEIKTAPGKMKLVAGEFRKLAKLAFEEMERIM